jgi:phosphatidate cytidylyltransferase
MSSVQKRTLTGTSISVMVLLLILLRGRGPDGLVILGAAVILSSLATWEVVRMDGLRELGLSPALPIAALLVAVPTWFGREHLSDPAHPWLVLVVGAALTAVIAVVFVPRARGLAAALGIWTAVPMYGFVSIDLLWGTIGMASLVILSKVGDIFGYFVGRAIGKRHPFPSLSPGKTVAGCVASLVAGVAAGAIMAALHVLPDPGSGILVGAVVGLVINLAAQAGDLLESKVKRFARVKDSSGLAGASGGVLDVIDSTLLTVPAALIVWPLVFA